MQKNKSGVWSIISAVAFVFIVFASVNASAYSVNIDDTALIQGECTNVTWSGFGDTCNIAVYKGNTFWTYANTQAPYQGLHEICTNNWEIRNDYKIRVEQKSNTSIFVYSPTFTVNGPVPYLFDFVINGGNSSTQSRNVSLQTSHLQGTPNQYMASENSNFSGAIWNSCSGSGIFPFVLSSGSGTKFVYFKFKNLYGESNVKWDTILYDPIMYYTVSGYVRDTNGQPIQGVSINGFSGFVPTTNVNGYYSMSQVGSNEVRTIIPTMTGYTFDPPTRELNHISGNTTMNFTAIPDVTYSWYTGAYGQCNDTCGGGKKTRVVECRDNNDNPVADSYCTGTKPAEESFDCPVLGPSRLNNPLNGEMYIE